MFQVYANADQRMWPSEIAARARRAEGLGYDGMNVPEAVHDGLLAANAALGATQRLEVATGVLLAFPRSPMAVAHAAWDLQQTSGGRFVLGLGSQVRGNIVGRYSTPWTPPVPRMREYVQALRAIWNTWQTDEPLSFEGEHYRFTRMQPFFNPGPIEHPEIPVFLGAVGPLMTALVGELADGMMTHPTNSSPRYLREVILPRVAHGAARAGRDAHAIRITSEAQIATGPDTRSVRRERERCRGLLGFLFSTPSYWPSLELYGWAEVGQNLHQLSRQGRWDEMGAAISDEMLDTLVVSSPYDEIAGVLRERFGGLVGQLGFPLPADPALDGEVAKVIARLKA